MSFLKAIESKVKLENLFIKIGKDYHDPTFFFFVDGNLAAIYRIDLRLVHFSCLCKPPLKCFSDVSFVPVSFLRQKNNSSKIFGFVCYEEIGFSCIDPHLLKKYGY